MPQRGHPSQEGLWALPSLPMAHEPEPEADGLLDLSFLTEEEQEAIADVLKRDAHLRQLEEGRVSKLRASVADPGQLKILTGDWFQEARSQRHHHAHFGSDLVRASIRRKKSSMGTGDQAPGSDGEAEAAEKDAEEEVESRLPMDKAPQEMLSKAKEPDFPSPYVPLKASDQEEEPQAQEAPGPGDPQVSAEEADPEPEPRSRGEEPPPPPAQTQAAPEILENGEEAPGPGSSVDRMLSSSSSVSSLNSSTLSGSQLSLSGEAEAGAVQVRGSVHFALRYEPGPAELRVHVIQCQGLAAARRRRSDPYVKSYLLPDKQSKRKTTVKKRNLNPVFNEILRYSIPQAELRGRVLSLSVWHRESLGRNIFLGEVEVPLDTWDWDSEPTWLPLQSRGPPSPDDLPSRGLLSLSLKYVPASSEGPGLPPSGELHFWVKEAQDLVPLRSGTLDTYVQCSVLPDDSRASRQRTRVVRRSLSPVFNHTMVYDGFGPADLRQACAELSLWDQGALASRQLGGTRLSLGTGSSYGLQVPWMDSTSEERQLWQTLLERPCEWVDGLLPLRTNLVPRT
ncbi:synaptotagmin-like protein 1 [Canis lupus baileyi]|nr:synaptotagmin-like protein 1 [Canis lupus familiaris]XP_025303233.1 synaptotagmin-like protein 1 isoform X1 [Canis lupus dingo]XP_038387344.1 synaptotagmin-like protein 1 [Canis lupus familiaris]XP_038515647.1 synaptotagmin-like protein 1 [Canis lupus familiaris]|eukprot:XP_005617777.1 synaptotagmin-like protein 1 isoform X1 [Canis lupus familiaris]